MEPDTYYENIEIDEDDEKALEMFMNKKPAPRRTLADIIMEKITEKHTELETQFTDNNSILMDDIDPQVKEMYEGVREVLQKYRSGKFPKAFKIIPHLRNWEQILYITGLFLRKDFFICLILIFYFRSTFLVCCSHVSSNKNFRIKFKR